MTIELEPPIVSSGQDVGFRPIFMRSPLPMWIFDNETLRILAVNEAAVEKYGWSSEEFLAIDRKSVV